MVLNLNVTNRPGSRCRQIWKLASRKRAKITKSGWMPASLRRADSAVHVPLRTVFANPELVQVARGHGLAVRIWTVNRTVDARLLKVLGVDAVITDVPATLRGALAPRLAAVD